MLKFVLKLQCEKFRFSPGSFFWIRNKEVIARVPMCISRSASSFSELNIEKEAIEERRSESLKVHLSIIAIRMFTLNETTVLINAYKPPFSKLISLTTNRLRQIY